MPSATSLIPGLADDTALTMAQRIGKLTFNLSMNSFSYSYRPLTFAFSIFCFPVRKVGIPIVLSVNLPSDSNSLQLAAERRIVEELQNF
jgi:hypothetical protein